VSTIASTQVNDLVFELAGSHQATLCIAVCDDPDKKSQLRDHVSALLLDAGREPRLTLAASSRASIIDGLLASYDPDRMETVFIVDQLERLSPPRLQKELAALNFRRDFLFSLSRPIVFWVTSTVLQALIGRAPDLWSRRTETYYFSQPSVSQLLARLFGPQGLGPIPEGRVADRLSRLFSAERELNSLFRGKKPIRLLQLDEKIRIILDCVGALIRVCRENKSFQVATSLWLYTGVDQQLRRMIRAAPRRSREGAINLYDERNEVLLNVSAKVVSLLEAYAARVRGARARKREVSLLEIFAEQTNREISRWWDRVRTDASRFEPISVEDLVEDDRDQLEWSLDRGVDAESRAHAVAELRRWLHGEGEPPRIFNLEEALILQLLYREAAATEEIAKRLGKSRQEVRRKISSLKGKVHAFLGVTPARRVKRVTGAEDEITPEEAALEGELPPFDRQG